MRPTLHPLDSTTLSDALRCSRNADTSPSATLGITNIIEMRRKNSTPLAAAQRPPAAQRKLPTRCKANRFFHVLFAASKTSQTSSCSCPGTCFATHGVFIDVSSSMKKHIAMEKDHLWSFVGGFPAWACRYELFTRRSDSLHSSWNGSLCMHGSYGAKNVLKSDLFSFLNLCLFAEGAFFISPVHGVTGVRYSYFSIGRGFRQYRWLCILSSFRDELRRCMSA